MEATALFFKSYPIYHALKYMMLSVLLSLDDTLLNAGVAKEDAGY